MWCSCGDRPEPGLSKGPPSGEGPLSEPLGAGAVYARPRLSLALRPPPGVLACGVLACFGQSRGSPRGLWRSCGCGPEPGFSKGPLAVRGPSPNPSGRGRVRASASTFNAAPPSGGARLWLWARAGALQGVPFGGARLWCACGAPPRELEFVATDASNISDVQGTVSVVIGWLGSCGRGCGVFGATQEVCIVGVVMGVPPAAR